jgi:hypothetical protein
VQRLFFSSGLRPTDFWESTFDEVLLVIKGKVDDWRFQRRCAWKIVEGFRGTAEMPEIYDFCPLAYDWEIIEAEKKQQGNDLELYKQGVAQFDNIIWEKKK